MIAVFARNEHPPGYGLAPWPSDQTPAYAHPVRRAHGYSVLLVEVADDEELKAVTDKLLLDGLPEEKALNHPWPWYGGHFDHVATVHAPDGGARVIYPTAKDSYVGDVRISKGDNRYVGVYKAAEILA
jgi:hypothetical protein